jgi:uncharacterized repeat protein (TIGR02543 family)
VHQLSFAGLSADTTYEYYVIWDNGESDVKTFTTGGGSEFSFLVLGDPQIGTADDVAGWANTMAVSATAFPQARFVVTTGDQISSSTSNNTLMRTQRNFDDLFAPPQLRSLPLAPSVGNHDGYGPNVNPQLWHDNYNTPHSAANVRHFTIAGAENPPTQFDYHFRQGNTLFIMLAAYNGDTSANNAALAGRRTWFGEVVSQGRASGAEWVVVVFHYAPYSANRPSGDNSKNRMITNWIPVLEQNNVDIVFNGHDHIYSRSHHMRGNERRLSQTWVSQADNAVQIARNGTGGSGGTGISYLAFGSSSGHGIRPAVGTRSYLAAVHDASSHGQREFSVVSVTPHTFSVATYTINGTGVAGNTYTMVDIYTIARPNRPTDTYIPRFCTIPRSVVPMNCPDCSANPCECPGVLYNMQTDLNLPQFSGGHGTANQSTHPLLGSNGGIRTANMTSTPRTLTITERGGTSQGVDVRLPALPTRQGFSYTFEFTGRVTSGTGNYSMFINAVSGDSGSGSNVETLATVSAAATATFTISHTATHEEIAADIARGALRYRLGGASARDLVITGITITEHEASGMIYNMQSTPSAAEFGRLQGSGGSTSSARMTDVLVRNGAAAMQVTAITLNTVRTVGVFSRGGTSQGLRIQPANLNGITAEKFYRIEITGRFTTGVNASGDFNTVNAVNARLRFEGTTSRVMALAPVSANGSFTLIADITGTQLLADSAGGSSTTAQYSIGNDSGGNLDMLIANVTVSEIDEIIVPACLLCGKYPCACPDPFTITFNPQGGTVSPTSAQTGAGGRLESLPTPIRAGWNFAGWFTAATGGEAVTIDHVFTVNTTIHARWNVVPIEVTFNANGGSVTPANATVGVNGQLASLPIPTREGFAFNGWFTAETGGEVVSANRVYAANTTIFAGWSQIRTVTFNPQGGSVSPTNATTGAFGRLTLTELPTPTRTGFTFDGWFTTAAGNTQVTLDRIYTANTTIHAQWTLIPVCSEDYRTCPIEGCVLCLPLPCADCGKYPCECPDFCPDCGQYPCNCPELCSDCDRYPCICVVICPDCDEEPCICVAICPDCDKEPCICAEVCLVCGNSPCSCHITTQTTPTTSPTTPPTGTTTTPPPTSDSTSPTGTNATSPPTSDSTSPTSTTAANSPTTSAATSPPTITTPPTTTTPPITTTPSVCKCKDCNTCGFIGGEYGLGKVTGGNSVTIGDALEILMMLAGLPNAIDNNPNALAAARITNPGVGKPTINDALEILMKLAGLNNLIDNRNS